MLKRADLEEIGVKIFQVDRCIIIFNRIIDIIGPYLPCLTMCMSHSGVSFMTFTEYLVRTNLIDLTIGVQNLEGLHFEGDSL